VTVDAEDFEFDETAFDAHDLADGVVQAAHDAGFRKDQHYELRRGQPVGALAASNWRRERRAEPTTKRSVLLSMRQGPVCFQRKWTAPKHNPSLSKQSAAGRLREASYWHALRSERGRGLRVDCSWISGALR
jgi:hypothetical protein